MFKWKCEHSKLRKVEFATHTTKCDKMLVFIVRIFFFVRIKKIDFSGSSRCEFSTIYCTSLEWSKCFFMASISKILRVLNSDKSCTFIYTNLRVFNIEANKKFSHLHCTHEAKKFHNPKLKKKYEISMQNEKERKTQIEYKSYNGNNIKFFLQTNTHSLPNFFSQRQFESDS